MRYNQYRVTVTSASTGAELDKQEFLAREGADSYVASEWADTDECVNIMMINKDGSRSIFDDVDE